jgi:hypothetical protein
MAMSNLQSFMRELLANPFKGVMKKRGLKPARAFTASENGLSNTGNLLDLRHSQVKDRNQLFGANAISLTRCVRPGRRD